MNINGILTWLDDYGVRTEWHSYIDLPSAHCFATWNIPSKTFTGDDLCARMREYPLEITFFYREQKKTADFTLEYEFENAMAEMSEYSCTTGYDSGNRLFYTQYRFDFLTPITIAEI